VLPAGSFGRRQSTSAAAGWERRLSQEINSADVIPEQIFTPATGENDGATLFCLMKIH
jgi:hypothetical protein